MYFPTELSLIVVLLTSAEYNSKRGGVHGQKHESICNCELVSSRIHRQRDQREIRNPKDDIVQMEEKD